MPNPHEEEIFLDTNQISRLRYIMSLEEQLKGPLTSQMWEAVGVALNLKNQDSINFEKNEVKLSVLNGMLSTDPEDLSFYRISEEDFKSAQAAATFLAGKRHGEELSQHLLDATNPRGNTSTSIAISRDVFTPDSSLSKIFLGLKYAYTIQGRANPIEGLISEGTRLGAKEFLNVLELPDKPLIPYQKNLGEKVMDLNPTFDKRGVKGALPTKVRGVTALYVYPNSQNAPNISIEVTRMA